MSKKIEYNIKMPFLETALGKVFYLVINTISVMVSWYFNKSILWGIFHYVFGTFYLIYRILKGSFADGGFMEIINYYF